MSQSITIIKGTLDKETPKAVLIKNITSIDGIDACDYVDDMNKLREQWFPLSKVQKMIHNDSVGQDEIHVETWICEKKGLVN